MRRPAALLLACVLAGCAAPVPTPSVHPTSAAVDCGELARDTCASVADAAETLTGTDALAVEVLPLPTDGGLQMAERYLVRLVGEADADEQLAEVVRFAGEDNWSVRRVESVPVP